MPEGYSILLNHRCLCGSLNPQRLFYLRRKELLAYSKKGGDMLFRNFMNRNLWWFIISLCSFLILTILPMESEANTVDLTSGYWLVTGHDSFVYDGSKLYFQSQMPNGDDYLLNGYFDWISTDGGHYGREVIQGTLFSDFSLHLNGIQILPPASGIGLANYEAEVKADGSEIINGIWYSPSGVWSAKHVPIPGAIWLLCTGLVGLIGLKNKFIH